MQVTRSTKNQASKLNQSQKLTTRRSATKSSLQKQNTNYVYLLSFMRISKAFYVWAFIIEILHHPNQHHILGGSYMYVKCSDGRYFELPKVNIGDDAAEKFLDQVLAAATICRHHKANNIPMKRLTQEQWREYNNLTNCSICTKPFKSADKKSPRPRTFDRWI